jgi:hypothetical protein
MTRPINIKSIFSGWSSPFVSRNKLSELTGGIINPKTLRNLDSLGQGIPGKFTVGKRTVAYPIESVVAWLEFRIKEAKPEQAESKTIKASACVTSAIKAKKED